MLSADIDTVAPNEGRTLAVGGADLIRFDEEIVDHERAAVYYSWKHIDRPHIADFHQLIHSSAGGNVDLTGAGDHTVGAELAAALNVNRTVHDQMSDAANSTSVDAVRCSLNSAGNEAAIVLYRNRTVNRCLCENADSCALGNVLQRGFRRILPTALDGERLA